MAIETRAVLRGVRLSAQKGRLVADMIRGKSVEQALNTLTYTRSPTRSTTMVRTLMSSK